MVISIHCETYIPSYQFYYKSNVCFIIDCVDPSPSNILDILEKQFMATSSVIIEQQKEINHVKTLCTSLHKVCCKIYDKL